jgi:predicted Zn-dependent peptidase
MATAKKQFETLFAEQFKDPRYWTQRLTDLNYRGLTLKDLMEAPAFYQNAKAEDVREAFARYFKPESTFSFVIMPEGGGDAPAENQPETK